MMVLPENILSCRGFTLIELIMSIVILGFVSLIMIPFVTSISHSPDPVIRQRAVALGQGLLDEIVAKKWDEHTPNGGGPICSAESPDNVVRPSLIAACGDPATTASPVAALGPDGIEVRITFDDVDDYHGLTASDNFFDQSGAGFSLPGYSRSVAVTYIASDSNPVSATSPPGELLVTTDTKRIVVTVVSPRQETLVFVALACNY